MDVDCTKLGWLALFGGGYVQQWMAVDCRRTCESKKVGLVEMKFENC